MGTVRRALGDAAPTLVVAADVIYSPALATALVRVLAALLLPTAGARALIQYTRRREDAEVAFFAALPQHDPITGAKRCEAPRLRSTTTVARGRAVVK